MWSSVIPAHVTGLQTLCVKALLAWCRSYWPEKLIWRHNLGGADSRENGSKGNTVDGRQQICRDFTWEIQFVVPLMSFCLHQFLFLIVCRGQHQSTPDKENANYNGHRFSLQHDNCTHLRFLWLSRIWCYELWYAGISILEEHSIYSASYGNYYLKSDIATKAHIFPLTIYFYILNYI
jgi:hypothetical protein